MDAEEFLPRMEVEELLKRYATGERRFINVNLSGADLSGLDFGRKGGKGIIYNQRIDFSGANLSGANLSGTNLSWAMIEFANLREANLSGANLDGVNFEGTCLIDAILTDANITGCSFPGADLTGANLTGARGGFGGKDTIFNNTIMPDGSVLSEIL
ncbi:MAG: pentapeptide repeat-containing protein [Cyanobacteria bacterium P01_A01_bin.83]